MNKKSLLTSSLAIGVLACAAMAPSPSVAQVTKQSGKYLFRIKLTKGATYTYSMTMDVPAVATGGKAETVSMGWVMKMKSVSNNQADLEVTTTGGPSGSAQTLQMTINNQGKILKGSAGITGGFNEFPSGPIAIGGTWTSTAPVGGMSGKTTNKLAGFKTVNGRQYAHVTTTSSMSGGGQGMSMTANGDLLIDMRDGLVFRGTVKSTVKMPPGPQGQPGQFTTTAVINRK